MSNLIRRSRYWVWIGFAALMLTPEVFGQGVTTGALNGLVTDGEGEPLIGALVIAEHEPSGTRYSTLVREGGAFNIPNMRVGGPYSVTVSLAGYATQKESDVFISLGQTVRIDFNLALEAVQVEMQVVSEQDEVLNSDRTGAATFVDLDQVTQLPSIKRSTRDLTRLDPRSDGNFSFGGRNWLYNNISLDGSYFNNPFGLDDPAPGGQTNAEPVPFDSIEQVQVSLAPFDVREGGFTGAGINSVTKSGTNTFQGSIYTYSRNEDLIGDEVSGVEVNNPDLSFSQTGLTVSGPIKKNKVFFFFNAEQVRRDDPGSNYVAAREGLSGPFVSRVQASDLDAIRQRLIDVYDYDPGPYEDYIHATDNDKLLFKLDWNINENNTFSFRYSNLDAIRDLPPHPFAISFNNTGRGPNENTLPFQNSGYAINNELDSYAFELNSTYGSFANRMFLSYNRFRDFRTPFSRPFPTLEIGVDGIAYTTVGHEPFSINNILDQDVWQFTNNFSYYMGKHVFTVGVNYEDFSFMNSFNLFFHGLFMVPVEFGGTSFSSVEQFFEYTDPNSPNFRDFNAEVEAQLQNPFKEDFIDVGQLGVYFQDEFLMTDVLTVTYGLRVDFPIYDTDLPSNTYSLGLDLVDENGNPETLDIAEFPSTDPLFSPRFGFNWDVKGDRTTQIRGGSGIFTGRLPFVWIGNTVSNQGPEARFPSFDLNGTDPDFEWPQVWTTNLAVDHELPWEILSTFEVIYGKDLNAIYVRNADLANPVGTIPGPDGRVRYDPNNNSLNNLGGAGVYILDNTDEGENTSITAQLRKRFDNGFNTSLAYAFSESKNQLSSTEIASFLWQFNAVQGNPNQPELSHSEFGFKNRIIAAANYEHRWSESNVTSIGMVFESGEGGFSTAGRRSRFSFVYAGDVNGDGQGGNDLIYIPNDESEINFDPIVDASGNVISTAAQQWAAFNAFIEQDDYLSSHRGQIAERFGGITPWYFTADLRILHDLSWVVGGQKHTLQLSLDILNFPNLIDSDWGVRELPNSAATAPLIVTRFNEAGEPVFQFPGTATETFVDDLSVLSRWQAQFGIRYKFN